MPPTSRIRRIVLPLAVLVLGLLALGASAVLLFPPSATQRSAGVATVGGPFTLTDQAGRTVTERDVAGTPYLVFFGFTHCPDICPTKLFEVSEVLRASGEGGKRLRALFVTVDPERDTPEVLKSYLGSFDERILGLTGPPEAVQAAIKAFRAYARKVPLEGGDYTMEHTAIVYLMDAQGRFVGALNLDRPPAAVAADLLRS